MSKFFIGFGLLFSFCAQADIRFSPSYVSMGMVPVRSTGYTTAYLYNYGTETVNISMSNTCYSDFYVSSACYGRLEPNFSCSITIRFSPQRVGTQSCQVNARDDNRGWATLSINGSGYENRR